MLKPQDLLVAVLLGRAAAQRFELLAHDACLSLSETHGAVRRLQLADLVTLERRLNVTLFVGFVENAARFVWPRRVLGQGQGLATAAAAPMFANSGIDYDVVPVWAAAGAPSGRVSPGALIEPLYKTMARAALQDDDVYALFALLEGARSKSARERSVCIGELRRTLMSTRSVDVLRREPGVQA